MLIILLNADGCLNGTGPLIDGSDPVPDSALTNSSQWSVTYAPKKARITSDSYWVPDYDDNSAWIQVSNFILNLMWMPDIQNVASECQLIYMYVHAI